MRCNGGFNCFDSSGQQNAVVVIERCRHSEDNVHKDIMDITNRELIGDDAVRSVVVVDTETSKAIQRDYSVIPSTEGDNVNIYTYSGSMKCCGEKVLGTATSSDGWQTITFTPETED